MAQITLNPADVTLSISRFTYTKNGNITWTKPTLTSDSIVISITLTGSINSSGGNVTEIQINNSTVTGSTTFNIDLGTDINITSVPVFARKSGLTATNVNFVDMTYTVVYKSYYDDKLYIGEKLIKNIYVGEKKVNHIYIGERQIL